MRVRVRARVRARVRKEAAPDPHDREEAADARHARPAWLGLITVRVRVRVVRARDGWHVHRAQERGGDAGAEEAGGGEEESEDDEGGAADERDAGGRAAERQLLVQLVRTHLREVGRAKRREEGALRVQPRPVGRAAGQYRPRGADGVR